MISSARSVLEVYLATRERFMGLLKRQASTLIPPFLCCHWKWLLNSIPSKLYPLWGQPLTILSFSVLLCCPILTSCPTVTTPLQGYAEKMVSFRTAVASMRAEVQEREKAVRKLQKQHRSIQVGRWSQDSSLIVRSILNSSLSWIPFLTLRVGQF